jgi:transcriptional regulator with XRE-family HTH domain
VTSAENNKITTQTIEMDTMNTEIEKTPAKPSGRKYASVDALLSGEELSQELRTKVSELKSETRVVLQLAQLRQMAGITQEDMAKHLGVTQSAVSKLETGRDEDVTLREIREYARVTDQRIAVMFGKPLTHVEAVKLFANGLKDRLEALAKIANQNQEFQNEIKGFFGEAFYNLFNILASCNNMLPAGEHDVEIKIEIVRGQQPSIALPPVSKPCKHTEIPA